MLDLDRGRSGGYSDDRPAAGVGPAESSGPEAIVRPRTRSDFGVRDGFAEAVRDEDGQSVGRRQPEFDFPAVLPAERARRLRGVAQAASSPAVDGPRLPNDVVEAEPAVAICPGVAEESSVGGRPVLTLRNSSERQSQRPTSIRAARGSIGFQDPAGERRAFRQLQPDRFAGLRADPIRPTEET